MKKITIILICALSLGYASRSFTQTAMTPPEHCQEFKKTFGLLDVGRLWSEQGNKCWITIMPNNSVDLKYRQFILSSEGMMMIFNSFGNGNGSQFTGAREYYFFPRIKNELGFEVTENKKNLSVTLPNTKKVSFKYDTAEFKSLDSAQVKIDSNIDPRNRGGLEILSYEGVYLDCGFQIGQSPIQNPFRFCQMIDAKRNSCRVQNQQIFNYDDQGNVSLKSEVDVKNYVLGACANIEWK